MLETKEFFCIHIVTKGCIRFVSEGNEEVELTHGDMFAIWPDVPFAYYCDPAFPETDSEVWFARFGGPLAEPILRVMGFVPPVFSFHAADRDAVKGYLSRLYQLAGRHAAKDDFIAVGLIHEMVTSCQSIPDPQESPVPLAERVRRFMKEEIDQGYNIDQLSHIFHISRSKLFLDFKKTIGKSPIEVLIELKIARASDLLANTRRSIHDIATACGYRDPLYFTRQFARMKGMPPGEFRRLAAVF